MSTGFSSIHAVLFMVGVTGFEPAASCSQSRRATSCATPRNSVIQQEAYLLYKKTTVKVK